jgi:hypothetical protein
VSSPEIRGRAPQQDATAPRRRDRAPVEAGEERVLDDAHAAHGAAEDRFERL